MMKISEWILDNFNKFNNYKDLSAAYNKISQKPFSKDTIRIYANRLGLFYGSGKREKENHIYTKEEIKWLKDNCQKYLVIQELADDFNKRFNINLSKDALKTKGYAVGIKFPNGAEIGHKLIVELNKGKAKKIGEIFEHQKGQKYIRVAITDGTIKNDYQLLQRYEYEKYHNEKLLENEMVIFLNGDRNDYSQSNLLKISKAEYGFLSTQGYMKGNGDIILTMLELYRTKKIIDQLKMQKRKCRR